MSIWNTICNIPNNTSKWVRIPTWKGNNSNIKLFHSSELFNCPYRTYTIFHWFQTINHCPLECKNYGDKINKACTIFHQFQTIYHVQCDKNPETLSSIRRRRFNDLLRRVELWFKVQQINRFNPRHVHHQRCVYWSEVLEQMEEVQRTILHSYCSHMIRHTYINTWINGWRWLMHCCTIIHH